MKQTLPAQIWRYALAGCAVFSLIAWWATDSRTTDGVTLLAVPAVSAAALPALAQTKPPNAKAQPAVAAPVQVSTAGIDTGNVDDVVRLRSRGLVLPVFSVSAAQLIDNYTQPRSGGATHEAIDIMAPRGTPVLAVEDGGVTKLFLSKAGGITLYLFDPAAEYAYYYAHLDRYAEGIKEGATVLKGQVIGYVGSTGNASPVAPHLHFAVTRLGPERQWWRGTPINPFLIWRDAKP